jgi:hypothetical protein
MWILFVIDTIVNTHAKDEIKYTMYNNYNTELECIEDAIELYSEFQNNEEAICTLYSYHMAK